MTISSISRTKTTITRNLKSKPARKYFLPSETTCLCLSRIHTTSQCLKWTLANIYTSRINLPRSLFIRIQHLTTSKGTLRFKMISSHQKEVTEIFSTRLECPGPQTLKKETTPRSQSSSLASTALSTRETWWSSKRDLLRLSPRQTQRCSQSKSTCSTKSFRIHPDHTT